jgi:DNA excision repair protein ERCC-4
MYKSGGCYIITSRILIVDLLSDKINVPNITGFLVPNAHLISETSMESFILRIFRLKNKSGFIKV